MDVMALWITGLPIYRGRSRNSFKDMYGQIVPVCQVCHGSSINKIEGGENKHDEVIEKARSRLEEIAFQSTIAMPLRSLNIKVCLYG